MKSLGTRLAIILSSVLLLLTAMGAYVLEKHLTDVIHAQSINQAQTHAESLQGSLKTLMLNGSGTLAREWIDQLHGVAGIVDIEVLRRDGSAAFTDLSTVHAVNQFLGESRFSRERAKTHADFTGISQPLFSQALSGRTAFDLSHNNHITVAMPIVAELACLSCHGYDESSLRGVLKLSLVTDSGERISGMRSTLWSGAILLVIALSLGLWWSIRLSVLKPLAYLRDAIVRVGAGERTTALPVFRQDELGDVAVLFNQMQEALNISESRARAVMDNVLDGIIIMDELGSIESINPAMTRIFGYRHDELMLQNVTTLSPEARRLGNETILGDAIGVQPAVQGVVRELMGQRKNGTVFPMEAAVSKMPMGDYAYYVVVLRDITARKVQTAALRYQAMHDSLTDLPNRSLLMDRLQQALRRAKRESDTLALILLDLDRFKEVNDTLGHHIGDKLLQHVGKRLRSVLRDSDTVARLGGDEFAILLPVADREEVETTGDKILQAMDKAIFIDGQQLSIGASMGVALFPEHGKEAGILMQHADVAMYVAKRAHKQCMFYDPDKDRHNLKQFAIQSELRNAISEHQMVLHYQPKLALPSRKMVGVEALVRWMHPSHGLLAPDEFIPLAEQTGLIRPLTLLVIEQALHEMSALMLKNKNLMLSINLSARDLVDPSFADILIDVLDRSPVPNSLLKFEVTETVLLDEPAIAIEAMNRLRKMGLLLSVDDFGIGYSSLNYLQQLPVQELKIDKSFGLNLNKDSNSSVIVRSTIDMAHELGLSVTAEGVESLEALKLLESLGCDAAQGFFLAHPMPFSDLLLWVAEAESKTKKTSKV